MLKIADHQKPTNEQFADFFNARSASRPSPVPTGSAPITHALCGATLQFDDSALQAIEAHNHDAVKAVSQKLILKNSDTLASYAEHAAIGLKQLQAIESADIGKPRIDALVRALDHPVQKIADAGNTATQRAKEIVASLNVSDSVLTDIFEHPITNFGVEYTGRNYGENGFQIVLIGQMEPVYIPVDAAIQRYDTQTATTLKSVLHTAMLCLEGYGVGTEASDYAERIGCEIITVSKYDADTVELMRDFANGDNDKDAERGILHTLLNTIKENGEFDLIEEVAFFFDGNGFGNLTIEQVLDTLYAPDADVSAHDMLADFFMRSYVTCTYSTAKTALFDDNGLSISMAHKAIHNLNLACEFGTALTGLLDLMVAHRDMLTKGVTIDRDEESWGGSGAVIVPCTEEEFDASPLYHVVNESYRFGMEADELGECWVMPLEQFDASQADSFAGFVLSSALLVYLSHITSKAATTPDADSK